MNRFLVRHFYLNERGSDTLLSEVVFKTEKQARAYSAAQLRKYNGFHSFYIVSVFVDSIYRFQYPIEEVK